MQAETPNTSTANFDFKKYGVNSRIYKLDKDKLKDEWMGMPSDDIDPENKKGAWCLSWARYVYSMFYNNQTYTTWDKLREYRLYRLYGAGAQPREYYMDLLGVKADKNNIRKGYYNVNWDIWSPSPKFRKIIQGRFESQDYIVTANAIDKLSGVERETKKWEAWAEKLQGPKDEVIQQKLGVPPTEEVKYVPESREELEMYSEMGGFKLEKEIGIEKAIAFTEYISDQKQIKRKVVGDLYDLNIAAYQDYWDDIDKKIKNRYLDPEMSVFDYSTQEDFKDMRFWGTQMLMSIKRVRIESGLPEEDLRKYALNFASFFGNPTTDYINRYGFTNYRNENGVYVYDNFKVPVWYCEWMSVDKSYYTERQTKFGTKSYKERHGKIYDSEKKKTTVKERQNVYCTYWIPGSEHVWSDGPLDIVPRNEKKQVSMTAHVYALPGKSIGASIIPNLDQLQINNLKLQNALAKARPDGIKIEFGSLNNINLGDGDMQPLELIKLYTATGDIIYKATTHAGKYNQYASPIEKIEGGLGKTLDDCIRIYELNFQLISELSGIDRISAVSQKP